MKIKQLALRGVGPLADTSLDLAPGLNVVLGPNECGKSTLCEALSAVLYGFPSKAAAASRRSWGPCAGFAGTVVLEIDGATYRIERDFASDDVQVVQLGQSGEAPIFAGKANPRGRTEESRAYRELLGDVLRLPGESVLRNSAYVGQLAVQIELDEELRRQISGAGQADYKRAGESLRSTYYALTSAPLPDEQARRKERRVEELRATIAGLRSQLAMASQAGQEMAALAAQMAELGAEQHEKQDRLAKIQAELDALKQYLDLQKMRERIGQQEQAQRMQQEQSRRLANKIADLENELAGERFASLRALSESELEQLQQYISSDGDRTRTEIAALQRREGELRAELAAERFLIFQGAPDDTGERLRAMIDQQQALAGLERTAARAEAGPSGQHKPVGLYMITGLFAGGIAGAVLGRLFLGLAGASARAALVGSIVGGIVLGLGAMLAGLLIYVALRQREHSLQARQIELATRLKDTRQALQGIQARLEPILTAAGESLTVAALVERWQTWTETQAELQRLAEKRALLEQREVLRVREDPRLGAVLAAAHPEALKERLAALNKLRIELAAARTTQAGLGAAQEGAQKQLDNVSAELRDATLRIAALEDKYPTFSALAEDRARGQERLERGLQERAGLEQRAGELAGSIKQAELRLATLRGRPSKDPAVLQEEIDARAAELERLELRCSALFTAITTLDEAIREYEQGHLAQLSRRAAGYFARFTRERYAGVVVQPGREIEIQHKDGEALGAAQLSAGARDQLYLALRLAVTDLLAADVQLPILLDDSFVNFDDERLLAARQILQEIATQRQVILLTHNREYAAWADRVLELCQ